MTDHNDKLIERLLSRKRVVATATATATDVSGAEHYTLRNPDGVEAALALQAAQKEIERLTGERDLWKSTSMTWAFDEAEAKNERDEALERAEATEAKVKELEKHVEELQEKTSGDDCACSYDHAGDVCLHHSPMLAAALRERDEALKALERIANHSSMLDELENCMEMRRIAEKALGDLRRARAARGEPDA